MPFASRLPPRLGALGAAALLSLGALTACSSLSGGPQSTGDACGVLAEGLGNVQEQVTAADTALTDGDPGAAQKYLASASAGLNSIAPQITNEEISLILADLTEGLNNVGAAASETGDPDASADALQSSSDELRTVVERFNTACGG